MQIKKWTSFIAIQVPLLNLYFYRTYDLKNYKQSCHLLFEEIKNNKS